MLLELRVENYRSIASEQALLMSASKDESLSQNTHRASGSTRGLSLLKSVVLYGPNGAGKSNLIRAAALMRHLVLTSATFYQAGEELPIEPFRLDPELAVGPTKIEVTFIHLGVRYQYGFSADSKRIHEEWLLAYPEGRAQTWFERAAGEWSFGPHLKGEKKRTADMTRDNALFLSVAASLNQQQLLTVFDWFQSRLRVLADEPWQTRMRPGYVPAGTFTMRKAAKVPAFKEKVVRFLRAADLGIEDFEVELRKLDETDIPADLPDVLRKELLGIEVGKVRTCHRASDGTRVWFELDDESDGTRNLFELIGPWIDTIESGYVLLVDEVFSNLHSMLPRELLTRFHAAPTAGEPAQVVMTTHDTSLLDRELLRRDQIWFIEKDRKGASRLYPLLDYKPRKDESLQRGYLAGRYGALPFLGEIDI